MRKWLIPSVLALLAFMPVHVRAADAPAKKPNIIFILADDLGIDGVSCYGADAHKTPNIDALAASGTRFSTCYAAPLCGPSRCLLMTGRYAFRTGGITNGSWRGGGPGAKSADEQPVAKMLKQAGYATCQAGKWRQVGEEPSAWGFDEYLTDPTASGWYWETKYNKNGTQVELPAGAYAPDVMHEFSMDFIRRHKDGPFFLYYAQHLVHKPTLKTPDTKVEDAQTLYEGNIRYMDKQVGLVIAELEKLGIRNNTLVIFSGDNGTAVGYPSPVKGRMINGAKASMWEGGSRVPFIASWPGVTPAGKVKDDIISFADPHATFCDIAGVKPSEGFKTDGKSFLPQLRGEAGTPRDYAYVQLGAKWFVREPGFKMNEKAELYDMADAPFVEKLISADADTEQSKAARARLTKLLADLNPPGGKADKGGDAPKKNNKKNAPPAGNKPPVAGGGAAGPWKSGDTLTPAQIADISRKPFDVSADIDVTGPDGVIVQFGGTANGYAIYLAKGKLSFAVRTQRTMTAISGKEPVTNGAHQVKASMKADGAMTLLLDGKPVAEGKASGPITQQPRQGLTVGGSGKTPVGEYEGTAAFSGKVSNVTMKATEK